MANSSTIGPGTTARDARLRLSHALSLFDECNRPLNALVNPAWTNDSTGFLYRREMSGGVQFRYMDLGDLSNVPAFDHASFACQLSALTGRDVRERDLPLQCARFVSGSEIVQFRAFDRTWSYSRTNHRIEPVRRGPSFAVIDSPDRKLGCFLRNDNVWLTDYASGRGRPLTTDGHRHFSYGSPPECTNLSCDGTTAATADFALWSPDSSNLVVFQTDELSAAAMPVIDFRQPGQSNFYRVSLPCDPEIITFHIKVIDVQYGVVAVPDKAPLPAVRSLQTPIADGRVWWSADGSTLYWMQIDRGEKAARIVRFEPGTGSCGIVFEESSDTYLDFGGNLYGPPCIAYVAPNELIWYSERSDRGQLYLYDLERGTLKRRISDDNWVVRDILHIDPVRREVLLAGGSPDRSEDPYLRKIYRASLDRDDVRPLTPDSFDHLVLTPRSAPFEGIAEPNATGCAPSGAFFVDTFGNLETESVSVVRDRQGKYVAEIEACDSRTGHRRTATARRVRATAADGRSDVWCTIFTPEHANGQEKFPVVDYVYAGPQTSTAPVRRHQGFLGLRIYLEMTALACLGFVVVAMDARGTGNRTRSFRDSAYGDLRKVNNLKDHVAILGQLADGPYRTDPGRVGIVGFSAGGFAAACAALDHPDTYRVAVSMSGNHEPLSFWSAWSERYIGLTPEAYRGQGNSEHAHSLVGKLLLIHGLLDKGCHPAGLFRFVAALNAAGKDYDLFLEPDNGHEVTDSGRRAAWRYLLRHLASTPTPPDTASTSPDRVPGAEE